MVIPGFLFFMLSPLKRENLGVSKQRVDFFITGRCPLPDRIDVSLATFEGSRAYKFPSSIQPSVFLPTESRQNSAKMSGRSPLHSALYE